MFQMACKHTMQCFLFVLYYNPSRFLFLKVTRSRCCNLHATERSLEESPTLSSVISRPIDIKKRAILWSGTGAHFFYSLFLKTRI